jgi:hypothetical protein
MLDGIPPLSSLDRPAGVRKPVVRSEPPKAPEAVEGLYDPFPESPPAEVLESLDHAQGVIADLRKRQLSLEFSMDEVANRIRVTVKDAEGHVVREVPVGHALETLSGDRGSIAVDAVG